MRFFLNSSLPSDPISVSWETWISVLALHISVHNRTWIWMTAWSPNPPQPPHHHPSPLLKTKFNISLNFLRGSGVSQQVTLGWERLLRERGLGSGGYGWAYNRYWYVILRARCVKLIERYWTRLTSWMIFLSQISHTERFELSMLSEFRYISPSVEIIFILVVAGLLDCYISSLFLIAQQRTHQTAFQLTTTPRIQLTFPASVLL